MARKSGLLVIMAGAVMLVCSAVAFAAVNTGNEGDNTLMGTRYEDSITGEGGDDKTVGKGGNDTYFYADGWGHDTVVDSGGTDTLDVSAVTGGVSVRLCSPVEASDSLSSGSDGGNTVTSASRIENARGSRAPTRSSVVAARTRSRAVATSRSVAPSRGRGACSWTSPGSSRSRSPRATTSTSALKGAPLR